MNRHFSAFTNSRGSGKPGPPAGKTNRRITMARIHIRRAMTCAAALLASFVLSFGTTAVAAQTQSDAYEAEIRVSFPENGGTAEIKLKEDEPSAFPYPDIRNSSVTLGKGQSGSFTIGYDEPGTFQYTIRQTTQKKETGVTYDDTVYNVTLFIASKDDGTLYHEFTVFRGGSTDKTDKISFVNKKQEKKTTGSSKSNKRIKTGDTAEIRKWTVLTLAGAAMLLLTIWTREKHRRGEL